jgi:hypothetical protein
MVVVPISTLTIVERRRSFGTPTTKTARLTPARGHGERYDGVT